jgi:hypothetical protein
MGCDPPTSTLAITLLVEDFYPFLVKTLLGKMNYFRSRRVLGKNPEL